MIPTPTVDWLALSPILALLGASGVALLGSVLVPWWMRRGFTAFVAFAGFVTAGVFAAIVFDETAEGRTLIAESFTRDRLGALAAIIVAGAGALTVLVSWGENRRDHVGEYYALLAAAGAGMAFFVTAGTPALYSGVTIRSPSAAAIASRSRTTAAGKPVSSTSRL